MTLVLSLPTNLLKTFETASVLLRFRGLYQRVPFSDEGVPFSDRGMPFSDESDRSDKSDKSDAQLATATSPVASHHNQPPQLVTATNPAASPQQVAVSDLSDLSDSSDLSEKGTSASHQKIGYRVL